MLCDDVLWLIWKTYYSTSVLCEFNSIKYVTRASQHEWDLPVGAKFNLRRTYIYE
jgi:hypothetical protein